jgi:hypothetical protein
MALVIHARAKTPPRPPLAPATSTTTATVATMNTAATDQNSQAMPSMSVQKHVVHPFGSEICNYPAYCSHHMPQHATPPITKPDCLTTLRKIVKHHVVDQR